MRGDKLHAEEDAGLIDGDGAFPLGQRRVLNGLDVTHSGVVDQDVEPAEILGGLPHAASHSDSLVTSCLTKAALPPASWINWTVASPARPGYRRRAPQATFKSLRAFLPGLGAFVTAFQQREEVERPKSSSLAIVT